MYFEIQHGFADISILSRAKARGKILLISCQPMLNLKTHSGFHELFRFWYVYQYKYGSMLWLEDGSLYLRLRKMSHTIYTVLIPLRLRMFGIYFRENMKHFCYWGKTDLFIFLQCTCIKYCNFMFNATWISYSVHG
jgi:hypothetical protein